MDPPGAIDRKIAEVVSRFGKEKDASGKKVSECGAHWEGDDDIR